MTYAVDLSSIAILIKEDGKITRIPCKTKQQADRKMFNLVRQGYKFDPYLWASYQEVSAALALVRAQCVPEGETASDDELIRDSGALLIVGRASKGPQDLLDALKVLRDYRDE